MLELDHLIVPSRNPVPAAKSLESSKCAMRAEPWKIRRCTHKSASYTRLRPPGSISIATLLLSGNGCGTRSGFGAVRAAGFKHRSNPAGPDDLSINTQMGGRNFYWIDSDGHVWEVLTVSFAGQGVEFPESWMEVLAAGLTSSIEPA
jgi:hypothetical protein